MIHTDNFLFIETKIGIVATVIVSLLKINALDDYMHGVYTAVGGLSVTLLYSLCKILWKKYKGKKAKKDIQ